MTMTDHDMQELDNLLTQTAQTKPTVPSDLMARVLIDAAQAQPRPDEMRSQSIWASLLEMIGGWPAVGGLALASATGLWIGIAPPVGLESMATTVFGSTQTVDLFGGDVFSNFSDGQDS